ncbi:TPA: DUF333 domain-containing protein [Klebsiella pneumoniae subsp. pneumoniae]|nr:DUF333 domain-containing protein [Klebsiella pneumoniae subsp. pneumoniae]
MEKAIIIISTLLIAGCSSQVEQQPSVGMANPASVYCARLGGTLEITKTAKGELGYCTLPSGERIEEWTLFRRDHRR